MKPSKISQDRDFVFGDESNQIVKTAQAIFCGFMRGFDPFAVEDQIRDIATGLTRKAFDDAIALCLAEHKAYHQRWVLAFADTPQVLHG